MICNGGIDEELASREGWGGGRSHRVVSTLCYTIRVELYRFEFWSKHPIDWLIAGDLFEAGVFNDLSARTADRRGQGGDCHSLKDGNIGGAWRKGIEISDYYRCRDHC